MAEVKIRHKSGNYPWVDRKLYVVKKRVVDDFGTDNEYEYETLICATTDKYKAREHIWRTASKFEHECMEQGNVYIKYKETTCDGFVISYEVSYYPDLTFTELINFECEEIYLRDDISCILTSELIPEDK